MQQMGRITKQIMILTWQNIGKHGSPHFKFTHAHAHAHTHAHTHTHTHTHTCMVSRANAGKSLLRTAFSMAIILLGTTVSARYYTQGKRDMLQQQRLTVICIFTATSYNRMRTVLKRLKEQVDSSRWICLHCAPLQ